METEISYDNKERISIRFMQLSFDIMNICLQVSRLNEPMNLF